MTYKKYPKHFNEEQNKDFDTVRNIMELVNAQSLIVCPDEYTILIELSEDKITPEQWDIIEKYNLSHSTLAEYVFVTDDVKGEHYYTNF